MDATQVADVLSIRRLLADYAAAVDAKDWDAVRAVFAPGARVDFTSAGGPSGSVDDFVEWVSTLLDDFPTTQHLVTNERVDLDGDGARSVAELINPMVRGDGSVMLCGGRYTDEHTRTAGGWRIAARTFLMTYVR